MLVEITSSFQSVTRQLALCYAISRGRMVSRENVTWNWYYYHQLIVIVLRAVKGTLRGSVKVPGGKVHLYRKHLPIREAIPRGKWWHENCYKVLRCDSAISINISISISIRKSLFIACHSDNFYRIPASSPSRKKINTHRQIKTCLHIMQTI